MADGFDVLEAMGRFSIFWLFIFTRRVRHEVLAKWKTSTLLGRVAMLFGGLLNALVGLFPVWVVLGYWLTT